MLEWATNVDLSVRVQRRAGRPIEVEAMPKDMPLPIGGQKPEFVRRYTEQVFLHAFAFMLHHELAHIRLHIPLRGNASIGRWNRALRANATQYGVSWLWPFAFTSDV